MVTSWELGWRVYFGAKKNLAVDSELTAALASRISGSAVRPRRVVGLTPLKGVVSPNRSQRVVQSV